MSRTFVVAVVASALVTLHTSRAAQETDSNKGLVPFYLRSPDGSCLTPDGAFGLCQFSSLWLYARRDEDAKEGHSLLSFLAPAPDRLCLARGRCRAKNSDLGPARCGRCGAKQWELVLDPESGHFLVTAEHKATCLVRTANSVEVSQKLQRSRDSKAVYDPSRLANGAVMQSCSQGGTPLQIVETSIHDLGFFLASADHQCFDGVRFRLCDPQDLALYWGIGVEFNRGGDVIRTLFKWHDPAQCLARRGHDTALVECKTGKDTQFWGLEHGRLSATGGTWCLVRDLANTAHLQKCARGAYEHVQILLPKADAASALSPNPPPTDARARARPRH